jgi:hypothetical protein
MPLILCQLTSVLQSSSAHVKNTNKILLPDTNFTTDTNDNFTGECFLFYTWEIFVYVWFTNTDITGNIRSLWCEGN